MARKLVLILFLFAPVLVIGQDERLTKSGFCSLTIKLTGNYHGLPDISMAHASHPLSDDRPVTFERVNDSTLLFSSFSFGPLVLYFYLDHRYLTTVILPNHHDILRVHYQGTTSYTVNYQGEFKEIFDHSHLMPEMVRAYFQNYRGYNNPGCVPKSPFKTAEEFRDFRLRHMEKMIATLSENIDSPVFEFFYSQGIENSYRTRMIRDYAVDLQIHNRNIGLDSVAVLENIPVRKIGYYNGIMDKKYGDTLTLMASSYSKFLKSIRTDSLLPSLMLCQGGPELYVTRLRRIFGDVFPRRDNLFFDMMAAGAYIDQIDNGRPLSVEAKHQVLRYFNNKDISNYILYYDMVTSHKHASSMGKKYHFPFGKNQKFVFDDIISRYKGKVIIIDFWATWCGPCIEAHGEMKHVKAKYAHRDDVAFLYVTNESSDLGKWNDYIHVLGGEHYYLSDAQYEVICDHYNIRFIPTYMVFNRSGNLSEINTGGYMGNDKLVEWIEKAFLRN